MLNPLMRCGAQIVELVRDDAGKPLRRRARRAEAERRLREVGIDDPAVVDRYPFELSGGMRQRVGIAAALARDPKLLIADEPSTALDVTTQKQILGQIKALQEARGLGLILITHDLRLAFSMCDRIAVLYAGSLLEQAPTGMVAVAPQHPYTHGLLLSEPPVDRRLPELASIAGSGPAPDDVADRCAFAPRCAWARPACAAQRPRLADVGAGHESACIRIDEIAPEMAVARSAAAGTAHVTAPTSDDGTLLRVARPVEDVRAVGQRGEGRAPRGRPRDRRRGERRARGRIRFGQDHPRPLHPRPRDADRRPDPGRLDRRLRLRGTLVRRPPAAPRGPCRWSSRIPTRR